MVVLRGNFLPCDDQFLPILPSTLLSFLSEMSPQSSIRCVLSHSVFDEDELVFEILPLPVILILVPMVCMRELGTQPIVNF